MAFPNPEHHQYYPSQYPQGPQYPQPDYVYPHHSAPSFPEHSVPPPFPHHHHTAPPQFPQHPAPLFPRESALAFPHHNTYHHPEQPVNVPHYPVHNTSWYPPQPVNGSSPFVKLSFGNRYSLVNTSVSLNGNILYKITTSDTAGAVTSIRDPRTLALISSLNRRMLHPDEVTFAHRYGGKTLKVKEWLTKPVEATKWTIHTHNTSFTFLWDISNRLLVYEGSHVGEPTAWFDPGTPAESFAMCFKNGMEHNWDVILTAVIYIVHKRLVNEKTFAVNNASSNQQSQWLLHQVVS